MAHLIRNGSLRASDIEYYLAYTTLIYEYADKYTWESILDFDFLYRERQAEYGFPWGAGTSHMEMQVLVANPTNRKQEYQEGGYRSQGPRKEDRPICKLFQARNGNCPFGRGCKFQHVPQTGVEWVANEAFVLRKK